MAGKMLIVTYYWPPAGGPGVQRWLKTAKEWQRSGQELTVLTVDPAAATYPVQDESLLQEVAGIKTVTTPATDWFAAYQRLTGRKEVPYSGFANQAGKPGPLQALSRFVRGNFFLPDPRKGWNRHALRAARQILSEGGYTDVITTGPPHSTHLIGRQLQRETGIAWTADFRDPWTDIYYYDRFYPTQWARAHDQKLERTVLEEARRVLVVSEDLKRTLVGKSSRVDAAKFLVLPNGYDPEDFDPNRKPPTEPHTAVLAYTGTLSLQYPVSALVSSFQQTLRQGKSFVFRMAGKPADEAVDALRALEHEFPNAFRLELLGYLPHRESVQLLQSADLLVLLIPDLPNNRGILTGKLFEYLGTGRPVWGFGPETDGDAQLLLLENRAGSLFDPTDDGCQRAAQALQKALDEPGTGAADPSAYTRAALAQKLLHWMHGTPHS
jgi:glycosyltransferase involved in cell wall biosynthesis